MTETIEVLKKARLIADFKTMDAYLACLGKEGAREMLWMRHPWSPDMWTVYKDLCVGAEADADRLSGLDFGRVQ